LDRLLFYNILATIVFDCWLYWSTS